jgi:hypothetical protein
MGTIGRWPGAVAGVLAVALGLPLVASAFASASASTSARASASTCDTTHQPYAGLAGATLEPEVHTSKDAEPVHYVMWRGFVPSFDGLPLSVDVTVPCVGSAAGPLPAVEMLHGFTDDKTVWEETGKTDTVRSKARPGPNSNWNEIWFASQGDVTLTYTARGWHDSCGHDTPGWEGSTPPPQCADHEYWIHLDDKRWEVRDAHWLMAGLVQSGVADRKRLAITGGSYGGAPSTSAALLDGSVVCGGAAQPTELGPDPCKGKVDGDVAPWTTPDGTTRLHWAAALPLYTFSDLLQVLAPNGRWTADAAGTARAGSSTDPIGVPLSSTVSGLLLAANAYGVLAPPGRDPDSDIATSTGRLLAGDPYDRSDPAIRHDLEVFERFKSPVTTRPQGKVPIFLVQGTTDALFPASEAVTMLNHLGKGYPVQAFFGDLGHDYAAERLDDWRVAHQQMNAFLDHYLHPERTRKAPSFGVTASIARCLDAHARQTLLHGDTWADLGRGSVPLASNHVGRTSTSKQGPSGVATDPISTATLPGPKSYKGCRIMRPAKVDPTAATYMFPALRRQEVVAGSPRIDLSADISGTDAQVAVRVWDVAPGGKAQGLVTRGVYRVDGAGGKGRRLHFEAAPAVYRFAAGHRIKLEITGNDSPYLLANHQQSKITIRRVVLDLPSPHDRNRLGTDEVARSRQKKAAVALVYGIVVVVVFGFLLSVWWFRPRRGE